MSSSLPTNPLFSSPDDLWADRLTVLCAQGLTGDMNPNNQKMMEAYTFAAIAQQDAAALAILLPYAPPQTHVKIYKKAALHNCVDVFRLLGPQIYDLSKADHAVLFDDVLPSAVQKDQTELVSWFLSSFYPKPRSDLLSVVAATAAHQNSHNVLSMILPDLTDSAWKVAVLTTAKFGRDAVFDRLLASRHPADIKPVDVLRAQVLAIERSSTHIARKLWAFSDHETIIKHAFARHALTASHPTDTAHVVNMLHDLWSPDELDRLLALSKTTPHIDGSWIALCPVVLAHQQKSVLLEQCPTLDSNTSARSNKM